MEHDTTAKRVNPNYGTVNLTGVRNQPVATVLETEVFGDWGLATDLVQESIAWDQVRFYDALNFYTNSGMLKKIVGRKQTFTITKDRPALYHSNNFTNPSVKRMNPYTFCGVIIWTGIPGTNAFGQPADFNAADLDLIHWNIFVRFDEWNPDFDQTQA